MWLGGVCWMVPEGCWTETAPDESTPTAIFGAQTASNWMLPLTGFIFFRFINDYRIVAVTPQRIVVLDAGKSSIKKARGIVTELPRSTRMGQGSGAWHVVPLGQEKLRVHRRFFKDLAEADKMTAAA